MSACAIDMEDYLSTLKSFVPDDLPPAARATVRYWLSDAFYAADRGNAAEVARLAALIVDKVAVEIQWRESAGSVNPPSAPPFDRLMPNYR